MLDFSRFRDALHVPGGLEAEGVHLPADTASHIRANDAYALAWFENWSRDGQPADGVVPHDGPYPCSPDDSSGGVAASGYAITGQDALPGAPSASSPPVAEETRRFLPSVPSHGSAISAASSLSRPESPAPGWYPSPITAGDHQWWDGTGWTTQRRPASAGRRILSRFARR